MIHIRQAVREDSPDIARRAVVPHPALCQDGDAVPLAREIAPPEI